MPVARTDRHPMWEIMETGLLAMRILVLAHAVVTVRMERMEKMARTVVMPCPRRSLSVITATGLLTV